MRSHADRRAEIFRILDASRPELERATPEEIARELMVQALDIVPAFERRQLFERALAELADERAKP